MLNATQIDDVFSALGLSSPSPAVLSALESIPDTFQTIDTIFSLPEVQAVDFPIMQMFELATGHDPTPQTLSSIASSALTQSELAAAFVGSQAFANVYNGGALMNPNALATAPFVDAMFLNGLGHAQTPTTEAGFAGLTDAQAFLEFSTSPTMTAVHADDVAAGLHNIVELVVGNPVGGTGPNTV